MKLIRKKYDELEVSFADVHVHVHNVDPLERKKVNEKFVCLYRIINTLSLSDDKSNIKRRVKFLFVNYM